GGGGAIGGGIAKLMAAEGAAVVVNDLGGSVTGEGASQGPAEKMVAEIREAGGKAVANYDNVASFKGAGAMVDAAIKNFGRLDILCHVAGILRDRMVFNMTEDEWDGVVAVHMGGAFNTVRNAVPHMIRQRSGRILLFSSGSGLGNSGQSNYSAAKEAMVGMAHSLAAELKPYNITINAIYPGGASRMTGTVPQTTRDLRAARGIVGGGAQGGRAAAFDEESRDTANNAAKAVYLCTEEGGVITGQVVGTSGWPMTLYTSRHVIRAISKPGRWTLDELDQVAPQSLVGGLVNPAPRVQRDGPPAAT
ncbi:MAG: SDR family NAD(P)-dependent oxidoreductase, partial [SAR202 cluster bacterium]|nr:SDR family NAD(P)-dependent oxidoreductase [SAR202 cluster bacterium]